MEGVKALGLANNFSVIKNKLQTKFMRNTGWLLFEQIFRMSLSLVVTSLMARYLGTHNYGLINYGLAYITIFTSVSKLGIDAILVNEIIKNRDKTGNLIGTTIGLRLLSSLFSLLIIAVVVRFLNPNGVTLQIITFIQSISLLFVTFDAVGFWFQSNLQSKFAVISKSIAFTIVSLWRLLLIYLKAPVEYFAIATILEGLVISVFIMVFYYKYKGPRLTASIQTAKYLLSRSYHFIISALLINIYTQMDKIILGQVTGGSTVGIYTAAMTIANLWIFIPNAIIDSARPIIMTEKENHNEELYRKRFKQLCSSIIWISVVASILITVIAKPIVFILYGQQYTQAVGVLIILIWSRIFSLIGTVSSIWLISENLMKLQKYFVGIGAVVNILLNLAFIPHYGASGSAIATLFAEVLTSTVALLIFRETRPLLKLILNSFNLRNIR